MGPIAGHAGLCSAISCWRLGLARLVLALWAMLLLGVVPARGRPWTVAPRCGWPGPCVCQLHGVLVTLLASATWRVPVVSDQSHGRVPARTKRPFYPAPVACSAVPVTRELDGRAAEARLGREAFPETEDCSASVGSDALSW